MTTGDRPKESEGDIDEEIGTTAGDDGDADRRNCGFMSAKVGGEQGKGGKKALTENGEDEQDEGGDEIHGRDAMRQMMFMLFLRIWMSEVGSWETKRFEVNMRQYVEREKMVGS